MDPRQLDLDFPTGGENCLDAAIALYGQPILRYCHHILCDYHEAQDAVQLTFLKAWEGRGAFCPGSSLRAWLYRTAYTTSIDLLRRRRRQLFAPPPPEPSAPSGLIGEDLRRALSALSPQDRALVYGRVMEEESFEALSQRLGPSPATLRKRYERARKKLARMLAAPQQCGKEAIQS